MFLENKEGEVWADNIYRNTGETVAWVSLSDAARGLWELQAEQNKCLTRLKDLCALLSWK